MLFAVDIDGTIAGDLHGHAYARYLNQELALTIPEQKLEQLKSYHEFVALEQVQAYASKSEEQKTRYIAACRSAQYDLDVQRSVFPLSNAVAGVTMLAQYGQVIYVTCRKSESRELTQTWLARYGFPQPEQVFFCEQYYEKCIWGYEMAGSHDSVTMVDDHAIDVIRGLKKLARERPEVALAVLKHFAFIVFGATLIPDFPQQKKFRICAAPSWRALEHLIEPDKRVSV